MRRGLVSQTERSSTSCAGWCGSRPWARCRNECTRMIALRAGDTRARLFLNRIQKLPSVSRPGYRRPASAPVAETGAVAKGQILLPESLGWLHWRRLARKWQIDGSGPGPSHRRRAISIYDKEETMRKIFIAMFVLSAIVVSAPSPLLAQEVRVDGQFQVDMNCYGSRNTAAFRMVNVSGQPTFVGSCGPTTGPTVAFFGHPDRGFTYIEFEPGNLNTLVGINSGGVMVGRASSADGTTRSYLVVDPTNPERIVIDGCSSVAISSITDDATIAGGCDTQGFVRQPDLTVALLSFPDAAETMVNDLTYDQIDRAITIGYFLRLGGQLSGFEGDSLIDAALRSFDVPDALATVAFGVNSQQTIVGSSLGPDFRFHGFIYDPVRRVFNHFDAPGATHTFMTGITSGNQFTGYIDTPSGIFSIFGYFSRS